MNFVQRWVLAATLAIVSVNAFAGGFYGLMGADGIPMEWLEGSPFSSYYIPSLILFVIVGGSSLLASLAVAAGLRLGRLATVVSAAVLFAWIVAQVRIIGYVSWLQPTLLAVSGLELWLARSLRLPGA